MMKQYFSSYKFQGDYLLRKIFSNEIKRALADYKSYTIVPIPLSEESLKKRKFNQVTGFLEDASISYQRLLEVQGKS
ncbi:ComF family protein, partial [Larkinella sp. C7]